VHLNKRSATGQRRKPQLGAGQYYAGAGATPFVSNPGPQTFSGYSDSFYGLQRQEQTASNIAAVIKREGDQANDSGNGGQPTNNMTPPTPGSQQGRNSISPLVQESLLMTPIQLQRSSAKNPITPTKGSPSSEKKPITPVQFNLLTPVKPKRIIKPSAAAVERDQDKIEKQQAKDARKKERKQQRTRFDEQPKPN